MRTITIILLVFNLINTNGQNQFVGTWFNLKIESYPKNYFDPIEVTEDTLDFFASERGYSIFHLYSFLEIDENGKYEIIGDKNFKGNWETKHNSDSIYMYLNNDTLISYIENGYLKIKMNVDTSYIYEILYAIKMPNSDFDQKYVLKGKAFNYKPASYITYIFHFISKNKLIYINNESGAKWSDEGTWDLFKYKNYIFLSINKRYPGGFLFFIQKSIKNEIVVYDFLSEFLFNEDYNIDTIRQIDFDENKSKEINEKLIGKWEMLNSEPIYDFNNDFKLNDFKLEIDQRFLKMKIETSEDSIYNYTFKYKMGEFPEYFIIKGDKDMKVLAFDFNPNLSQLVISYSVDSDGIKYRYPFKISLKKM